MKGKISILITWEPFEVISSNVISVQLWCFINWSDPESRNKTQNQGVRATSLSGLSLSYIKQFFYILATVS